MMARNVTFAKQTAAAVVLAAGALATALGTSPSAHADADQFISDLNKQGFSDSQGSDAELAAGRDVCKQIVAGQTVPVIIEGMSNDLHIPGIPTPKDSHLNHIQASQFVHIAMHDLCPFGLSTGVIE
jgi:hypothetical protein